MNKRTLKVLQEIHDNAPKHLLDSLLKKEKISPAIEEILRKALEEDNFTDEQKRQYKTALDSGIFSQEVEKIDEAVEKQLSDYFESEVKKAIDEKRIPPPPSRDEIIKKLRQKTNRDLHNK